MKKWIILITAISLLFIGGVMYPNISPKVSANAEMHPVVSAISPHSIELSWNSVADHYKIFSLDGKELWSGKESHHQFSGLDPKKVVDYRIVAYDKDNEVIDTVRMKSMTPNTPEGLTQTTSLTKSKTRIVYPLGNARLDAAISNNAITLNWANLPNDEQQYEVYRDGKLLAKVKGNSFTDENIEKGKFYRYSILSKKKLPQEQINQMKEELKKSRVTLTKQQWEEAQYEPKELTMVVKASNEIKPSNEVKAEYVNGYGYLVSYDAFIPMEKAINPECAVSALACSLTYYSFHGDNRGFSDWGQDGKFRVRSRVYLIKGGAPRHIEQIPETNPTIGYDIFGRQTGKDKAPTSDIKLTRKSWDSNYFYYTVNIASSNPLVTGAPAIDATIDATVANDGSGSFHVIHDQAPSHEMVIYTYPGDIDIPLMQDKHQGFLYLFPGFPQKEHYITCDPIN